MVTVQDVHGVTFEKGIRGYQVEQVDTFLDQVAAQIEQDERRIAELTRSNDELKARLCEMAKRLESYRSDEDALKSALLNAQRMGENVIREARQKADALVREASIRAEDIDRAAQSRIGDQQVELERIKSEVAQFKSNVLSLYKAHIESLSTLPDYEEAEEAPAAEPEAEPAPLPEPVPAAEPEPAPAQEPAAEPVEPEQDSFWEKDEAELAPAAAPAGQAETASPFRGITFSD